MASAADSSVPRSVPGDEAPLTLDQAPPKTLGALDQGAFWANLGVSLLGFSGALVLLDPLGDRPLSFPAALLAAVVGSLIGTAMVVTFCAPRALPTVRCTKSTNEAWFMTTPEPCT